MVGADEDIAAEDVFDCAAAATFIAISFVVAFPAAEDEDDDDIDDLAIGMFPVATAAVLASIVPLLS